jgi:hypothetical protein
MSNVSTPNGVKDFWDRPEGKTGKLFLFAFLAVGGYFLYKGLPYLITILENTLYTGFLLGTIAVILFLLFDPKVRTLISYSYRGIMRGITKLFIELDPLNIINNYIEDLLKNLQNMDTQTTNLKAQIGKLNQVIRDNEKEMVHCMRLAEQAAKSNMDDVKELQARKAGRKRDSNLTLQALATKMELLYRMLNKYQHSAFLYVEDLKDEVSNKKSEREAIRAGHSAFKSAMKIIKGDDDKAMMFEMAMQNMADDIGSKVGEMEKFMDASKGFMDSVDLQNGIFKEDGLQMLEEWEKNGVSFFTKKADPQMLAEPSRYNPSISVVDANITDYSNLLRK